MTNTYVRRILIISGVVGICLFFLFVLLFGRSTTSVNDVYPTPSEGFPTITPIQNATRTPRHTVTPTRGVTALPTRTPSIAPRVSEAPPDFTGAIEDDGLSTQERTEAEQSYALRTHLPISTDAFTLSFDYVAFTFVVVANGDQQTTKQALATWLTAHGYTALSIDMFVFR